MLYGADNRRTSELQSRREAMCADVIDIKHLRRYTLGDIELEREVLELFLSQLPQTIAALHHASSERDWRIAAHTLKGSGRAVGAWRIATLAESAERLQFGRNRLAAADVISRIEQAATEAREFIASHNGERRKPA